MPSDWAHETVGDLTAEIEHLAPVSWVVTTALNLRYQSRAG